LLGRRRFRGRVGGYERRVADVVAQRGNLDRNDDPRHGVGRRLVRVLEVRPLDRVLEREKELVVDLR